MRILLAIAGMTGTSTLKGFSGQIECDSFTLELKSPRDPATGQASGKRTYSPVVVTKTWDQTSPLLGQTVVNNTVIPKATFTFVPEASGGTTAPTPTLVVELANVQVLAFEHTGFAGGTDTPQESYEFSFQTITLNFSPIKRIITDSAR